MPSVAAVYDRRLSRINDIRRSQTAATEESHFCHGPRLRRNIRDCLVWIFIWIGIGTVHADGQTPASIQGVVVRLGSGEPLGQTTVELFSTRNPSRAAYSATTADDGKFAIQNILEGTYRLLASRNDGLLPVEYGQRSPNGPGRPISLTAGQVVSDIRLAMWPTGSISGRIFERDGEPVARAQVQALRRGFLFGDTSLAIAESAQTNDRGEYRLFWLPAGEYFISAGPIDPKLRSAPVFLDPPGAGSLYTTGSSPYVVRRMLPDGVIQEEAYPPVYFPGVTDVQGASAVTLQPGDDLRGVDMILADPVAVRRIRGTVIRQSTGQPAGGANVQLVPRAATPNLNLYNTNTSTNGTFEIAGVIPGSYSLMALIGDDDTMAAVTSLDVGSRNIDNLALVVGAGFDIPVRVLMERPGSDRGFLGVRLVREPPIIGTLLPPPPRVAQNLLRSDAFTLQGVGAGDYRLDLSSTAAADSAPRDAYVKAIRYAGRDALNEGLHIQGPAEGAIEIVIGTNPGIINGSVVNERAESLANVTVALVPDVRDRRNLYKMAATDIGGQFHLQEIPPGDYTVFAWEDIANGAWRDPEVIRRYDGRGRSIHIAEGSRESIQVTAIPAGR